MLRFRRFGHSKRNPKDIPLDVLFEDDDLIVVNKPERDSLCILRLGNQEHTLVNALLHYCRGRLAGIGGVERPGIVHRLDKGTSGCIVVAKTGLLHAPSVGRAIQVAWRERKSIARFVGANSSEQVGTSKQSLDAVNATARKCPREWREVGTR